ncbi:hypothetical protein ABL78_6314 [Leptomonas seymouri]|uniref:Sperm-tail PG-rich repeat n=1 Tax=Leptomonas seymouri TaxID=5684 RepID=A0A0N1PAQ4_LEPSE|nr:hypothetical protein ABL78_6314 [Leptomonas seymouri]|eukprot:KPI84641.1 hypothetical protein ABL78_6314 [Leptomonas seymouri]
MSVLEELPLIRAKGVVTGGTTGPKVGPGSYDLDRCLPVNSSRAPFNTTSTRQPLSDVDPTLPGPGAYDVSTSWSGEHGGIGSRAFACETARFDAQKGGDVPGPGAYNVRDNDVVSKNPKTYSFSAPYNSAANLGINTSLGPGAHYPNYAAADRRVPRAANFGKYSGRELPRPPEGPGPGSYNSLLTPHTLAATKPSSMFVTKTKRTLCGGAGSTDTPGPGTYDAEQSYQRDAPGSHEHFSAFGSSSARFADGKEADRAPGPGMYDGDIAPRRFYPQGNGSAAFLSTYDRFPQRLSNSAPGPGTYDWRLLPRHNDFGESMPFGSTVPRFSPVWSRHPLSEPLIFSGDPNGGRAPRSGVRRPFVQRKITPSSEPPPLQDRAYDVRYDWPKPTSTLETTFGTSSRMPPCTSAAVEVPGPGAYIGAGSVAAAGRKPGNSSWGRDLRFVSTAPASGTPDPGKYYYSSTFLKKSHNATIGSDTTWIG